MISYAFTCTGPYALLIMLGIKRVENRSAAPEPRQGRCAISCSKSFCKGEYGNFVQWASQALSEEDFGRASWLLHPRRSPVRAYEHSFARREA